MSDYYGTDTTQRHLLHQTSGHTQVSYGAEESHESVIDSTLASSTIEDSNENETDLDFACPFAKASPDPWIWECGLVHWPYKNLKDGLRYHILAQTSSHRRMNANWTNGDNRHVDEGIFYNLDQWNENSQRKTWDAKDAVAVWVQIYNICKGLPYNTDTNVSPYWSKLWVQETMHADTGDDIYPYPVIQHPSKSNRTKWQGDRRSKEINFPGVLPWTDLPFDQACRSPWNEFELSPTATLGKRLKISIPQLKVTSPLEPEFASTLIPASEHIRSGHTPSDYILQGPVETESNWFSASETQTSGNTLHHYDQLFTNSHSEKSLHSSRPLSTQNHFLTAMQCTDTVMSQTEQNISSAITPSPELQMRILSSTRDQVKSEGEYGNNLQPGTSWLTFSNSDEMQHNLEGMRSYPTLGLQIRHVPMLETLASKSRSSSGTDMSLDSYPMSIKTENTFNSIESMSEVHVSMIVRLCVKAVVHTFQVWVRQMTTNDTPCNGQSSKSVQVKPPRHHKSTTNERVRGNGEDSDEDKFHLRKRKKKTANSPPPPTSSASLLACPFNKYDGVLFGIDSPDASYGVCSTWCSLNVHHLKQHLQRVPRAPEIYCYICCRQDFASEQSLRDHLLQRTCEICDPPKYRERISNDLAKQLHLVGRNAHRTDAVEYWYEVFDTLFPGVRDQREILPYYRQSLYQRYLDLFVQFNLQNTASVLAQVEERVDDSVNLDWTNRQTRERIQAEVVQESVLQFSEYLSHRRMPRVGHPPGDDEAHEHTRSVVANFTPSGTSSSDQRIDTEVFHGDKNRTENIIEPLQPTESLHQTATSSVQEQVGNVIAVYQVISDNDVQANTKAGTRPNPNIQTSSMTSESQNVGHPDFEPHVEIIDDVMDLQDNTTHQNTKLRPSPQPDLNNPGAGVVKQDHEETFDFVFDALENQDWSMFWGSMEMPSDFDFDTVLDNLVPSTCSATSIPR